jgi:hypothetical protein
MAASTFPRIWMLALLALLALMTIVSSASVAQPKLDVRFGIVVVEPDGQSKFVETAQVPNVVGQVYGWIANIEPSVDPITWSEELKLPKSPLTWPRGGINVSEDRKAAQTRGSVLPGESEFSNFWIVTPGDPTGTYSVIVKVFDGVVADFTFEVVDSR